MNERLSLNPNDGVRAEHSLDHAIDTRQYETIEGIHHPNSQDFKTSGERTLRDFFHHYPDAMQQIGMAAFFTKRMRERIETQAGDCLSFGHDNEGTISTIVEQRTATDSHDARNLVEITRFNPLEATDPEQIETFQNIELIYSPDTQQATAQVQLLTGETIDYVLHYGGGSGYVTRTRLDNSQESSPIYYAGNLDHELEYDHPSPQARIEREYRARLAARQAFHGL